MVYNKAIRVIKEGTDKTGMFFDIIRDKRLDFQYYNVDNSSLVIFTFDNPLQLRKFYNKAQSVYEGIEMEIIDTPKNDKEEVNYDEEDRLQIMYEDVEEKSFIIESNISYGYLSDVLSSNGNLIELKLLGPNKYEATYEKDKTNKEFFLRMTPVDNERKRKTRNNNDEDLINRFRNIRTRV